MPSSAASRDNSVIPHDPPNVTVIIPTKDRYGFLSRALDSVFAQEGVAT